ncbi:adenylate kinase family enzyme [Nakamurella sp. UYEF19]|uniref:hypothetical protein n=1 Tax=Nakamurella sp. UYEF19 TaxID=1756392 RepID=UPI003398DB6B
MVEGPRRLVVTGGPGSGKTSLAALLAVRLAIPHIELDGLYHGPNWTPTDPEAFRASVSALTAGPAWIVDGNYRSKLGDLVLARTDLVIALDLPRPVVLVRLLRRTLVRMARRTELWNGNREEWRNLVSTDESRNLLLWAHRHFGRYRARAIAVERASAVGGPAAVRLTSPAQVDRFVEHLMRLAGR